MIRTNALIDPALVRELSLLSPGRSLFKIALEWCGVLCATWLCLHFWHPALYLLAVAFIGARQHALAIIVHDGAHYRLAKNRKLSDAISELFCAWPLLLTTTHRYRQNHLQHHLHLNSEADPDFARKQTPEWKFPQRPTKLLGRLFTYALGWGTVASLMIISSFKGRSAPADPVFRIGRILFFLAAAAVVTAVSGWKIVLLFWIVPLLTWTQLTLHIRSIAEHFAIPEASAESAHQEIFSGSRTTRLTLMDRMFIGPRAVGYHLEHHLFPSVPFYNLEKLHDALMDNPEYRDHVHVSHGYHRVLLECVR